MEIETKKPRNKVLCPVTYNGRKFFGIREFDCKSIGLFTEKTLRGTFFTHIPISPLDYRKEHSTRAWVSISKNRNWTTFDIYSDWGELSVVKIHNSLPDAIEYARQKAIEECLL